MHLQDQIFLERMSSSKEVRIGTSQNNSSNSWNVCIEAWFRLPLTQKHGIVKRKKGTLQFCLLIWVACIIFLQKDSSRERLLPSKNWSFPTHSSFIFLCQNNLPHKQKKDFKFFRNFFGQKNVLCHINGEQWVWQECDAWVSWSIFNAWYVGNKIIWGMVKLFDMLSPQLRDTKHHFFQHFPRQPPLWYEIFRVEGWRSWTNFFRKPNVQ